MKKLLFITMLLGALYSTECEEWNAVMELNYNCDCNESTWQEYYNSDGHNMEECWLYEANLSGAYLNGANLGGAILNGVDLTGAYLVGAYLVGADLEGACLEGAIGFTQTNYSGTPILEGCASEGGDCSFEDTDEDGYDDVSFDEGFNNGAAMVQDTKTGQIVAMMGSRSYNYPNFGQDNAVTAFIQPGSTIKPLIYGKLFSKSDNPLLNVYGSGTVLADTKTTFDRNYTPNNADRTFLGNIPIRKSLALSRNIPAIKAMDISGVKSTLEFVRDAGDTYYCTQGPDAQVGLAAAIGGCGTRMIDHVNAFSTLARSGQYKPYSSVLEVKNSDGETLKKWSDPKAEKVMSPEVTYILADILSDDNARAGLYGTNFPGLVVDGGRVKTASKTGTSDVDGQSKDIWMMSYSPALTMGVWLGNPDTKPLRNGNSSLPGPIVDRVMSYAHQNVYKKEGKWKEGDWYNRPAGIKEIRGELYPSWYDEKNAQKATKLTFDKVSKKKATECTPPGARTEVSVLKSTDPETKKTVYLAPSGYKPNSEDDVHKCGDPLPNAGISIDGDDSPYTINVTVTKGKGKLTKMTVSVNGKTVNAKQINKSGLYSITYSPGNDNPFTVKVVVEDDLYYSNTITKKYEPAPSSS